MVGDPMSSVLGIPATKQREAVDIFGHPRTQLGEVDPRDCCFDDAQGPAHSVGGQRLGVKRVVMTRSSLSPDKDAMNPRASLASVGKQTGWLKESWCNA